jgi:ubiquinone/menaquinone biosynthesis C-methylase UbiE
MNTFLKIIPNQYKLDSEGIFCNEFHPNSEQFEEVLLREKVAVGHSTDYLQSISQNHSIPVMDYEIDRFLKKIPFGGVVLDVGGCWGWHWRRLSNNRPDIQVIIVDFVRANLIHARSLLSNLGEDQLALMRADATNLPFVIGSDFCGFDGVWSVQTFQHIPSFEQAISEVYRVLKVGGVFFNYSLNYQPHIKWIKRFFGRDYQSRGFVEGNFWLARASSQQKALIEAIFSCTVSDRWTEILFSPEIRFFAPGRESSLLGSIDSLLSNNTGLLGWLARQRSFECEKLK